MKKAISLILTLIITVSLFFSSCAKTIIASNNVIEEKVSANAYGYMFLNSNGDLYSYGKTGETMDIYMLGVENAERIDIPTKILSDVIKITDNFAMPAAITSNGDLYVWGYNGKYQILGFAVDVEIVWEPTKLMEDVLDVGYGYAIKTNGDLWVWGPYGDINPSTGEFISTAPYKKMNGVKKCINRTIYYVLKSDGTLWAWGYDKNSSRGNGKMSIEDSSYSTPVKIMDDVADISAEGSHILALKTDGTVWAWGSNEYGQIGNGENGDLSSKTADCIVTEPLQIMSDVASIYSYIWGSFAITNDGSLYGWGRNSGYILNRISEIVNTPTLLMENVKTVFKPTTTTIFIITDDDKLYSWGEYGYGSLGTDYCYSFEQFCQMMYNSSGIKTIQYCYEPTLVTDGVESILGGYIELMFVKMKDGTYRYWGMDTYKTVETYGEANYIEFLTTAYNSSFWCRCDYIELLDFPDDYIIPDAICHHLEVIKYPTECTFPPYIGG